MSAAVALAPAPRKAVRTSVWQTDHYRIQPLPQVHRLIDLDAQAPADPGLNFEWIRTGQYPRFRSEGPAETVPDDFWVLYPDNRVRDGGFDSGLFGEMRILDLNAKAPTGAWQTVSGKIAIRLINQKLTGATDEVLDNMSLEELLEHVSRAGSGTQTMYYI